VSSRFWALNACGLWISRLSGPMTAGCTDRKSCTEERNGTLDITWYNPKCRQKKISNRNQLKSERRKI
jgi:hypothetical protein